MFIIYDLIFLLLAVFYIPVYLFKGKFHRGLLERLGKLPADLKLDSPIWIHAVSVGEAMAVRPLIEGLRKIYPGKKFVISTVTPTGNKIAKSIVRDSDFVTYLPLDFSFIVGKVLNKIRPALFIIAETEIWPNLISQLSKRKIPVIVVNGRISDRALSGYRKIRFFIKPILKKISIFCVQSAADAEKFKSLGVQQDKIKITGNLKFDSVIPKVEESQLAKCREKLCLNPSDKLLVCGSTHPQEEEIILEVYQGVLKEIPDLKLLIAPRHPQRSKDIAKIMSKEGLRSEFISNSKPGCSSCIPKAVFILDVIGELNYFYALADIVFIGGSLVKKGGHNILEPASQGKPVLFGPHMFNFRDVSDLFLKEKAAIQVFDRADLKNNIGRLLSDTGLAKNLGQRAKRLVLDNTGATQRTLELIKPILKVRS